MASLAQKFQADISHSHGKGIDTRIEIHIYYEQCDMLIGHRRYMPVVKKRAVKLSFATHLMLYCNLPRVPSIRVRNLYYIYPHDLWRIESAVKNFLDSYQPEHQNDEVHEMRLSILRNQTFDQTGKNLCMVYFPIWCNLVRKSIAKADPSLPPKEMCAPLLRECSTSSKTFAPSLVEYPSDYEFKLQQQRRRESLGLYHSYWIAATRSYPRLVEHPQLPKHLYARRFSEFQLSMLRMTMEQLIFEEVEHRFYQQKRNQKRKQTFKTFKI